MAEISIVAGIKSLDKMSKIFYTVSRQMVGQSLCFCTEESPGFVWGAIPDNVRAG